MPKRRACRGLVAEVPGVVSLSSFPAPHRMPPLASRSIHGGELQTETRTSDTEDEHPSAVEAPAASAGRAQHPWVVQAETRTSGAEDEHQRAVDAAAAWAARAPHRRLPPNRPGAPRLAIRSDAVVEAGGGRGADGTGCLLLVLRQNRGT
jgi:hypothetical protein